MYSLLLVTEIRVVVGEVAAIEKMTSSSSKIVKKVQDSSASFFSKFQIVKKLGEGSYGRVVLAITKDTGEAVAIKVLKGKEALSCNSAQDCFNMREVKALVHLGGHPNIIQLREIVKEGDMLGMVFEYMDGDLGKLIERKNSVGGSLSEPQIRFLCFQILNGLHHMHGSRYFHRDLKPDNILIKGAQTLKIADFGFAREFSSGPSYSDYVTTRWYRAPEVLLFGGYYNSAVDMWALGCIMAELFLLRPIFPGRSTTDQIHRITSIMGTPDEYDLPFDLQLTDAAARYQFPQLPRIPLSVLIPHASESAIDLMTSLLSWSPVERLTAEQALQHSFFQPYFAAADHPCSEVPPSCCQNLVCPRPLFVI